MTIKGGIKINLKYNKKNETLIIQNNYLLYSINLNDVYYFERLGRKIDVALFDKRISFYGSFVELENILDSKSFLKCHKSYIVNSNKIFKIDKDEISFSDIEDIIIVSENFKNSLISFIIQIV